jgi:hypothetical protein
MSPKSKSENINLAKCKVILHLQVTVDLPPEILEEKEQVSNQKHAECNVNLLSQIAVEISAENEQKGKSEHRNHG